MTKRTNPQATEILRKIDDPEFSFAQLWLKREGHIKEIIKALRLSGNAHQRVVLCYVLGLRQAKSAYPLILEYLGDPSSSVRCEAAEALDKIGNPAAGSAVFESFLAEKDPAPKSTMAMALGGVKYSPAIPALIEALNDADQRVGNMAFWSLGYMGTQETIQQLQVVLEKETDAQTQAMIRKIIDEISSKDI